MELKNAAAVCLITLFSATLVVLIARSLDMQLASQLEPQLTQIAEELRAIREAGGMASTGDVASDDESVQDGVVVYYFHGNTRCPTCRSIESQSLNTVVEDFAPQMDSGEVIWKILNYEKPSGEPLAKQFDVQTPVVVLVRMEAGQMADWKRLDKVWALVGDPPVFREYVRDEIAAMLGSDEPPAAPSEDVLTIPIPDVELNDLPLPSDAGSIPIPQ